MRCITRIHLSDCGWHEAYYPGTTVHLADPRTGEPAHTVFSLENTGGKTSFLSLVLSCFDTSERRFLKTLIRANQKFGDYFGEVPAFILVEWDLSGGQAGLPEAERLVTGQVVVPRGEGRQRELERRFFTFRSVPGLSFDEIPAPGLEGFEEHGRLRGHQDVQRWLHAMRSGHPGNFQDFVKQSDWKRKLAEEKIDTELLAAQVEFNRSEGGIEDFPGLPERGAVPAEVPGDDGAGRGGRRGAGSACRARGEALGPAPSAAPPGRDASICRRSSPPS